MSAKESANEIEKIGRYRIAGEIGRGGMGVVYQGEDRLIGRRVAIKTLTEVTPELRERFYIEARSGILNHPNIVTVYEVDEYEGNPFIVMEYVEGDSLEKILRLRRRLPLLEAISIVEQLCTGLGYAHGHGVLHRDVKPANILIRPDGRVTIVDFGIARLADQTQQLTKTNTLLGTFHYIAPERLKGEESDGRADIWSVGVMFYEMLTGELPFKGSSNLSSLYRVIHEPYVPLVEHVQDLPDGLIQVLDKALAKPVDARYRAAEDMALDLQKVAEGMKHERVGALLETARQLTNESQYSAARTVLLQVQRIDPGNTETKTRLSDVQEHLTEMHRSEQLRLLVDNAKDAANGRRWNEAASLYEKAQKLDIEDAFDVKGQLQQAQQEQSRQQKVLALWKQADEARNLDDLKKALDCLDQAIEIDGRNTDLRNAHADLLREVQRKRQARIKEIFRESPDPENSGSPDNHETRVFEIAPGGRQVKSDALGKLKAQPPESSKEHEENAAGTSVREKAHAVQKEEERASQESQNTKLERAQVPPQTTVFTQIPDRLEDSDGEAAEINQDKVKGPSGSRAGRTTVPRAQPRAAPISPQKQPQEVVANENADEVGTAESRKALDRALAACNKAINAGRLDQCMRPLDDFAKQYGAGAALATARKIFESKREHKATQVLQDAMHTAQRQLRNNSARKARMALKRVEYAVPLTTADVRGEWQRLMGECTTALSVKQLPQESSARAKPGKAMWYVAGPAVFVAALVIAWLLYRQHVERTAPHDPAARHAPAQAPAVNAPGSDLMDMEINASPWAKIVAVQDESGNGVPLPSGDTVTPLRLDGMKAGTYKVTFVASDGDPQTVACNVSSEEHLCAVDVRLPDTQQVLMGEQP